ncbi:MAG: hypothetical protein QXS55_00165 [Candidatus Woesearchaeota archaeon]
MRQHYNWLLALSFALLLIMCVWLIIGSKITGMSISEYFVSEGEYASVGILICGLLIALILAVRESALEGIIDSEPPFNLWTPKFELSRNRVERSNHTIGSQHGKNKHSHTTLKLQESESVIEREFQEKR